MSPKAIVKAASSIILVTLWAINITWTGIQNGNDRNIRYRAGTGRVGSGRVVLWPTAASAVKAKQLAKIQLNFESYIN